MAEVRAFASLKIETLVAHQRFWFFFEFIQTKVGGSYRGLSPLVFVLLIRRCVGFYAASILVT